MFDVLTLGFLRVVWPLIAWCSLFFVGSLVAGVVLLSWARKRARRVARPTALLTALIVATHLFVLPLFATAMAVPFSLQRSVGQLVEQRAPSLVDWTVSRGTDVLARQLGIRDELVLVDFSRLRRTVRQQAQAQPASLPVARAGPAGALLAMPVLLEGAFWKAMDLGLDRLQRETLGPLGGGSTSIRWKDARALARRNLLAHADQVVRPLAERFHGGARRALLLMLVVTLLAALVLMLLVRGIYRSPR